MGVNISDIDVVVHWGLPTSPLSYWQEVGRCARDERSGYAIYYAYKRSFCKRKEDDDFRKLTTAESFIRVEILKIFLLQGMDQTDFEKLKNLQSCDNNCENKCQCQKCKCCTVCQKECTCQVKTKEPFSAFIMN